MMTHTLQPAEPAVASERGRKRDSLLAILRRHGGSSVVLTSVGALSWYLGGARVHVSLAGDPVLAVVVTPEGDTVLVPRNEADRLADEELPSGLGLRVLDWYEPLTGASAEIGGPRVLGESDIAAELRAARASLQPAEIERYSELCGDAATLLTRELSTLTPASTEREVTTAIGRGVLEAGADPLVLLGAGRDRLRHRHPLPTDAPIGDLAMFVVCARRGGLIANVTRWVRFGEPSERERDAEARILEVEADYFAATRPGATLSEVLAVGAASYAAHGFAADEWMRHHQGGPCGYNGRDPRATPGATDVVVTDQAFAWNPSAPGVKVEDTVLLTGSGIRVLSVDADWPTTEVRGLRRPSVLQL